MKKWKCSKCRKEANYHVGYEIVQLYFCDYHWAQRLGFKRRNAKKTSKK